MDQRADEIAGVVRRVEFGKAGLKAGCGESCRLNGNQGVVQRFRGGFLVTGSGWVSWLRAG